MGIWNELMIQDHPRRAGPLVDSQIRYLIRSEHGRLGGFGFSTSALQLKDRDQPFQGGSFLEEPGCRNVWLLLVVGTFWLYFLRHFLVLLKFRQVYITGN